MKKLNSIIAVVAVLVSAKAMASLPGQSEIEPYWYQPTPDQFARDIAELEFRGVIENLEGRFVLKNESALDKLRREGRVDLVVCANSVVCY